MACDTRDPHMGTEIYHLSDVGGREKGQKDFFGFFLFVNILFYNILYRVVEKRWYRERGFRIQCTVGIRFGIFFVCFAIQNYPS